MGILCGKEKGKSFAWFESAFPDKLTWIIHTVPVSADVILYQPAFQTTGTDSVHRSEIYANMWKRLSLTGRQCDNIPHSKWKEQWLTTLKVNTSCHRFLHRHRVSITSVTFGKKALPLVTYWCTSMALETKGIWATRLTEQGEERASKTSR